MKNKKLEERRKRVPEETRIFVKNSFDTAKQIDIILKRNGWSQKYFAELLGKEQSEISKWMSGVHNFTHKTISKIEAILKEKIILFPKDINPITYRFYYSPSEFMEIKAVDEERICEIEDGKSKNLSLVINASTEGVNCRVN